MYKLPQSDFTKSEFMKRPLRPLSASKESTGKQKHNEHFSETRSERNLTASTQKETYVY